MSHANAALTPKARLKLGRLVVEDGWSVSMAARRFEVTYRTAQRWARRFAEVVPRAVSRVWRTCRIGPAARIGSRAGPRSRW
jgi:transposase